MKQQTMCIAAYKGEIGSFLLGGLLRVLPKALDIFCFDINETEEEKTHRLKISDIVFLCVPLKETLPWLIKYQDILVGKIIIEQCSLKEPLFESYVSKKLNVRSMHILFRPSQTPSLQDRRVGLFEGQFDKELVELIAQITQAQIVWFANAAEHDKEMAIQQALLHRTILILGDMFDKCHGSTYVSKKVLELRDRIKGGSKDLYKDIQGNRYLGEQIENLSRKLLTFNLDEYWK